MKNKFLLTYILSALLLTSCSLFGHKHTLVHHVGVPSTCLEKGALEYWSCSECGKRFSDYNGKNEISTTDIEKSGHSPVYCPKIESTCTEYGEYAHFECSVCKKLFLERECKTELESVRISMKNHEMEFHQGYAATETRTGFKDYYQCSLCHGYFLLEDDKYTSVGLQDLVIDKLVFYDVVFDYPGYESQHIESGSCVTKPQDPEKASTQAYTYTFSHWLLDGKVYDFSTPISGNITLTPHFTQNPINYSITFICEGQDNIVKYFNCETDPDSFVEPDVKDIPGYVGTWSAYDLSNLTNQTSYASYTEAANLLSKPVLEKYQGYTIRFKTVKNATSYIINDNNDYRTSVVLNGSDADSNGYLYYTTEVVGKHTISVTAQGDGYVSRESNKIVSVENEPVFAYSPFASVLFYDNRDNPQSNTYSCRMKDGSWTYVTNTEFDSTYIRNQGNIVDYTTEPYISNIMNLLKESGSNVVNLGNRFVGVENFNAWWWGSGFSTSALKRAMDAAWKVGLKCLVTDFTIMNQTQLTHDANLIKNRLTCAGMKEAIKHPAFYGIELTDEPMPGEEMTNTGITVHEILDAWHNDSELSKLPDPILHTDLCSFNTNKNSDPNADPYLFPTAQSYEDYLESWITATGLNYFAYDVYTYTTYIYGQKSYLSKNYFYDSSKVIMDAINNLKAKHPGLVVHQTITTSNYSGRLTVTYQDVFASTLLSLSQNYFGYSVYTFFPESNSQKNQMVDYDFNKTTTYTWAQNANKMYIYIKGLLNGFSLKSNEMSTYKQKVAYNDEGIGYGYNVRTSTSIFEDANGKQYKMIVNFNTYTTNTTTSVALPNGTKYYYLGNNKSLSSLVSDGSNLILNNGEAVLFELN